MEPAEVAVLESRGSRLTNGKERFQEERYGMRRGIRSITNGWEAGRSLKWILE